MQAFQATIYDLIKTKITIRPSFMKSHPIKLLIILMITVSMSRGISYVKYENGRLTGLVTSYVETAF